MAGLQLNSDSAPRFEQNYLFDQEPAHSTSANGGLADPQPARKPARTATDAGTLPDLSSGTVGGAAASVFKIVSADLRKDGKPDTYEAGTWGPQSAVDMLARDGRTWRRP